MTNDADKKQDVANAFIGAANGYLDGEVLRRGEDLERLVDRCSDATRALDVATGAGHVAGALADRRDRMDVPAARRREIRSLLSDAPPALEDRFDVRYEPDGDGRRLQSYRTGVVLLRATG